MTSNNFHFANCICIGCQDRRKEWREKSTPTDHDAALTPSQQATPEAPSPAQSASATGGGAPGVERLSGPSKQELVVLLSKLNEWEIQPLLFLARRLVKGQAEYGPERKYRDWWNDMAEEAADFVAYAAWARYEGEGH
ncbi:MAG: hypothetical protein E6Q97_30940 [Desulfurellales bacterium]|nr:MAG: hypothetical protein E6Q97_30940 [Desulfurellales bacterium]